MPNPENIISNTAFVGINTDAVTSQLREGQLTYAHNAVVSGFDGKSLAYQNEASNELCFELKEGYQVIGVKTIMELSRTLFFMVNPQTGDSEIGYKPIGTCTYHTLINGKCLRFDPEHPIRSVAVKITNCSSQVYWTDGFNPRRWMDLDQLPISASGEVDCNQLLVQPNFSIPTIIPVNVSVGGDLLCGAYQFAIQYANATSQGYTSFYSITNPVNIFEQRYTQDFNLPTTKAITLQIDRLDTTGLYDYFNLAVVKTINNTTSVELVGTFPIQKAQATITYTGNAKSDIRLSIDDIFERFPYYDIAQDLTSSDNTLIWAGLSVHQRINYQQIWSKVKLQWETWKIPYNRFEGYFNPVNTSEHRGYMGDEVYAFEGCFLLRNGKITEKFHIPGRLPTSADLEIVDGDDRINFGEDACKDYEKPRRWQLYNTANIIGYSKEYLENGAGACYKGPYQFGEFGYWQSTQNYPNNRFIWGDLAGRPIRHHRFPDATIVPIHDNSASGDLGFEHAIFPKGVKVNIDSLYKAIETSDLSEDDKRQIVGFKIIRANRASSKSVVAKGLFFNVGKYTYEGSSYFYPNYPFNDLRPDPFLANSKVPAQSGVNHGARLRGFESSDSRQRFTFHSPDTHFYQPYGIDSGFVKLETVEYGKAISHFVEVKENAKYKFLTKDATRLAFSAGMSSVITLQVGGGFGTQPFQAQAGLQLDSVIPSFEATLSVIKNITPAINYGWQLNAVGNYSNSVPVAEGDMIRATEIGAYLGAGMQSLGDKHSVNNLRRESSVYLKLSAPLPYPHEVSGAPVDDTRYLISEKSCSQAPGTFTNRNVSAYYGAIKKIVPDQYGSVYSFESVDTGYYQPLHNTDGSRRSDLPTVFGGDVYIGRFALKRKFPFFLDDTVGKADGADIDLDDLSNVAYPMFWYSTKPVDIDADLSGLEQEVHTLTDTGFWTVLGNLVSGGTRPLRAGFTILTKLFRAYLDVLGVANLNLDCPMTRNMNELGKAYLYAYGIPYFFTESEVNVDMRQAINPKDGDFFPNMSGAIPDDWLQEVNVPIAADNLYIYNKSYSKQNKETHFAALREDFDPSRRCLTHFENRVIYSQKSDMEETKNNWLVYRPVSYFDFPRDHGPLCAIDGLEDRRILTRFHNKSLLYNVMATMDTTGATAYLGSPAMFSQPPLDFIQADLGYGGSQHKFLLKTPHGHIWTDALRGQVLLLQGSTLQDLTTKGMYQWFREHLPQRLTQSFPQVEKDNSFHQIGICGTYDGRFERLILTKRDYAPLHDGISFKNGGFWFKGEKISLDDSAHFCDLSWTLSYSFGTESWISFHGYIPRYYVSYPNFFETGSVNGVFTHNQAHTFGRFYGVVQPYILEYPLRAYPSDAIIGSVQDYTSALRYLARDQSFEPTEDVYFNKAIIYSDSQCSGVLELIPRPKSNLQAYLQYPRFLPDVKQIVCTRTDHLYSFNTFWDIVSDKNAPFIRQPCNPASLDKVFINLDYGLRSHAKSRIRAKEARLRLIYDQSDQYQLVSKFVITQTQTSIK